LNLFDGHPVFPLTLLTERICAITKYTLLSDVSAILWYYIIKKLCSDTLIGWDNACRGFYGEDYHTDGMMEYWTKSLQALAQAAYVMAHEPAGIQ
jgi:hypothetical protein